MNKSGKTKNAVLLRIRRTLAFLTLLSIPFLATSCAKCDNCGQYKFSTHSCRYMIGTFNLCDNCEKEMDDAADTATLIGGALLY